MAFDAIVSSPARRTRETLDLMRLAPAATWLEPLYHATAERLLEAVRDLPESAASALVVGHNPGLQQLVLALAGSEAGGLRSTVEAKFPTGALAIIACDIAAWRDIRPRCGELAALILPRDLG